MFNKKEHRQFESCYNLPFGFGWGDWPSPLFAIFLEKDVFLPQMTNFYLTA